MFFGCNYQCFREFPAEKYRNEFSFSVGASFPLSEGKRDSLGETIYLALKMQTVRSALRRHLYQSQVSGALCDHEESEMEYWTQTALNWARIAGFACPWPSQSLQMWETAVEGEVLELLRQEQILLLLFYLCKHTWARILWSGYLQGFIFWQCSPKPPFHWTKL